MATTPHLEALRRETARRVQNILSSSREITDCLLYPWGSEVPNLNALLANLEKATATVETLMAHEREAKRAAEGIAQLDADAKAQLDLWDNADRAAQAVPTTDHDDHPDGPNPPLVPGEF